MNWILGIHMGHDASISLLSDGKPIFCLSEERLTREKMYYGFPLLSLEYLWAALKIDPNNVGIVALDTNELPELLGPDEMLRRFSKGMSKEVSGKLHKARKLAEYLFGKKASKMRDERRNQASEIMLKGLKDFGFNRDKIRIYDHHACHAASAFWPSPFDEAVVITSDGRGDGISATMGFAQGSRIEKKLSVSDLDSIGQFYAAVTFFAGFRPNRHEGKITGLAAHGDPERLGPLFYENVIWNADGTFSFRIPEKYRLNGNDSLESFIKRMPLSLKDRVVLHTEKDLSTLLYTANWYSLLAYLQDVAGRSSREDIAAGAQYLLEKVFVKFVQNNLPDREVPVVLAGGVFANVLLNQKIRELPGVGNIFIQPAMGDDGLSLGAALLAFAETPDANEMNTVNSERLSMLSHVYLGPQFAKQAIIESCKSEGVAFQETAQIEGRIAEWIHKGMVIGYFHGAMEFGPRALGHRSILVRPTDKSINESLNRRLKRTEFMPFAPSMLAEHASEYLDGYRHNHIASEFMTITYSVNEHKRKEIQAVVHIDGTARPQVVHKEKEPTYHRIISEYHKLSGIPAIINTSFNAHEEPIVCTPQDAIRSLKNGCIDILIMENIVVQASGLS